MQFLCELYEAQVARGRYFVHELTSEVKSRKKCVAKIMAIPGTRTVVEDQCMFGLAVCDKGGPGFVNVSVRTVTNARRVGARLQNKCTGTHRHARINANDTIEEGERTGTWVRQAARATEVGDEGKEEKVEDVKKIRGIVHEKDKRKGSRRVQIEVGKLMHHDEQELLSVWEGWHWDDNKGGWLDRELCAKARQEEVEYIRRHKETPSRQDGRRPTRGNQGSPTCAKYKTHARPELYASTQPLEALKIVLLEIATGKRGGKVVALIDVRRAFSTLQHEEGCLSNCRLKITSQATNTCEACCNTACTAHATPHKLGRRSSRQRTVISN